jgi:hypothetical protein
VREVRIQRETERRAAGHDLRILGVKPEDLQPCGRDVLHRHATADVHVQRLARGGLRLDPRRQLNRG